MRHEAIKRYRSRRRKKENALKRIYGITLEDWNLWFEKQKGRCAICGVEAELCVDHCHVTSRVRGLLCHKCNKGIGLLGDNENGVKQALKYLEEAT